MLIIKTTTDKIKPHFIAYENICSELRETKSRYRCAVANRMNIDLIAALKTDLIKLESMKVVAENTLLQYAPKINSILTQLIK